MTRNIIRWTAGMGWILLAASLLLAGRAHAQESGATEEEMAAREEDARVRAEERLARQEEVEARLEEAQGRLEEAAREIAELSARLSEEGLYLAIRGLEAVTPRPMLGVNVGSSSPEEPGVRILGVTPGGPADNAGLRAGDVIIGIDDEELIGGGGGERLSAYMEGVAEGQAVEVRYRRSQAEHSVTVMPELMGPMSFVIGAPGADWEINLEGLEELEELAELEQLRELGPGHGASFHFSTAFPERWGDLELITLTPELGEYFDADRGLLVVRAPDDDQLRLVDGDVILAIDGREPSSPRHAMRILRSYEPGESIRFTIIRQKKRQDLEVVLPEVKVGDARHWPTSPEAHPVTFPGAAIPLIPVDT